MLRNLLSAKRLRVACFDFGDEELRSDHSQLRRLLGAIVHQAMHDGMMKVRIGVDRASRGPFIKYFGPIDYDQEKQIWWDMCAPPPECYPAILQVCLSLAELEPQLPVRGTIPAIRSRKRLTLDLEMHEINSFQIGWDERHCGDRCGDRPIIDLPAWEAKEGDDSDEDRVNGEDARDAGTGEGR